MERADIEATIAHDEVFPKPSLPERFGRRVIRGKTLFMVAVNLYRAAPLSFLPASMLDHLVKPASMSDHLVKHQPRQGDFAR
ncbi:MAG TPA: hypothetical protein VHU42_03090 [Rhodopila sp.]|nr:hypothetical protein [Rhodopila sp.]